MAQRYYIVNGNRQEGPFALDSLTQRQHPPGAKIWMEGLTDWTPLDAEMLDSYRGVPSSSVQAEAAGDTSVTYRTTTTRVSFESTLIDLIDLDLAPAGKRLVAQLINWVPIWIVVITLWDDNEGLAMAFQWLFIPAISLVTYHLWSGSLGHFLLGMKVVSINNGSDYNNPILGACRELVKTFLFMLILPMIWLLWDKDKQNLYDKIFGTTVVDK